MHGDAISRRRDQPVTSRREGASLGGPSRTTLAPTLLHMAELVSAEPPTRNLRISASVVLAASGRVSLALSLGRKRVPRRQRQAAAAAAAAAAAGAATLCFDLGSFGELMTDGETSALARQLVQCYGYNRSLEKPFCFALAGLSSASSIVTALDVHSAQQWVVQRHESAVWEAFPGKKLCYLSSDAEDTLSAHEASDSSTVLIIGGLVDYAAGHAGGSRVGAALRVAEARSVRAARLPIEEFVTVRKPSLTCTAVVQILAGVAATGDWGSAVRNAPAMKCAPLRKYVKWNGEAAKPGCDPPDKMAEAS